MINVLNLPNEIFQLIFPINLSLLHALDSILILFIFKLYFGFILSQKVQFLD